MCFEMIPDSDIVPEKDEMIESSRKDHVDPVVDTANLHFTIKLRPKQNNLEVMRQSKNPSENLRRKTEHEHRAQQFVTASQSTPI